MLSLARRTGRAGAGIEQVEAPVLARRLLHGGAHPLGEQDAEEHQPDQVAGRPEDAAGQMLVVQGVRQPRVARLPAQRAVVVAAEQRLLSLIVTPRKAWNGNVRTTSSIRKG